MTTIDLFAGAGGLSVGFEQMGFKSIAANDFDQWALKSYARAFPQANIYHQPIETLDATTLLADAGLTKGEVDCLIGGPPCQAFSINNHARGFHDARSGLFREYLRVVADVMPRTVVMENVTGMLSLDGGQALKAAKLALSELGYRVDHAVLKAEHYGVPQERRRIVLVGTRGPVPFEFPTPTHGGEGGLFSTKPLNTIADAISDLPPIKAGESGDGEYVTGPESEYQAWCREHSCGIANHVSPRIADVNFERLSYIPPGGSWRDIPFELLPEGMKRAKRSDHTKRYGRPRWDQLSGTVLTKCDPHWGAFFHPDQSRTFSVREIARLQSFPDNFVFEGPTTEQFRQIGNAVPPMLAQAIAQEVRNALLASK